MIGSLCVMCKIFPYMSMRVDEVRPCRIDRLSSSLIEGLPSLNDSPLIWGDEPVDF